MAFNYLGSLFYEEDLVYQVLSVFFLVLPTVRHVALLNQMNFTQGYNFIVGPHPWAGKGTEVWGLSIKSEFTEPLQTDAW